MAKHPHLLQLINKKTWRCMLEGCNFFVHLGLAHVLIGKTVVCWNCEDKFIVSEMSLMDAKPWCDDCRAAEIPADVMEKYFGEKERENGEDK